ncbi:hypothetical protein VMCG_10444 [Cytospora schulzeri]|uniref:Uncharacterized protein n=1 Tax=Cytospora schulzeri TaxID=448051 RepID=A0A423VBC7_9PEZI|nr:hypothetical protein VMCG_10444 [Valsa malicola]
MPSWFKEAPTDPIEVIGDELDQHFFDKELPIDVKSKVEGPPAHEQLDDDQAARRLRALREHALNDPNLPAEDRGRARQKTDAAERVYLASD